MMDRNISRILTASLFIIPLCGAFSFGPLISIQDSANVKEFLVLITCLSVGILGFLQRGSIVTHRFNYPIYALLAFLPLSIYCSPPIRLQFFTENMGGIWMWKALAWIFLYWIMYETIIRTRFDDAGYGQIAKAIGWAAIISAGYALIQAAYIDQFQFTRDVSVIGSPSAKHITGMIGCPTYLAVWLVMCLPFIMAYFRWPWWILTGIAVLFCKSDIGNAGLVLMVCLWPAFRARNRLFLVILALVSIIAIVAVAANFGRLRPYVGDNGRFSVWEQVFEDFNKPAITRPVTPDMTARQKLEQEQLNSKTYPITGRGLGSFPYYFSPKYSTKYETAHNEYLEIPYSIGLIGFALFMAALGFVLWFSFIPARADLFLSACYVSFLYSCIAAAGVPLWHYEPMRFFSAITFIMLSRRK